MKKIYSAAWVLTGFLFLASVLTGKFNALSLFVFSLVILGLVYALMLWTVIDNYRVHKTE